METSGKVAINQQKTDVIKQTLKSLIAGRFAFCLGLVFNFKKYKTIELMVGKFSLRKDILFSQEDNIILFVSGLGKIDSLNTLG